MRSLSISGLIAGGLRYLLPPRCPACGLVVDADHRFCAECWGSLRFLGPPWCEGCNKPFAYDRGEGARCGACLADPPRHAGVRAAVAYGPVARGVALKLKYGRRPALARTMGALIARHVPPDVDLLVPVPLHRSRLWSRGFNQAALIATAVTRQSGVPSDLFLLIRHKRTPLLRGQGRKARARTVAGAFSIATDGATILQGRTIGLVDDVYTSGATTDACVAMLLRAGAAKVVILCWARVIADDGEGAALH